MFINKCCLSLFGIALLVPSTFLNAHSGPLNAIAVKACANKVKSQSCRYEGGHNDLYIGSCQYMGDDLMCVRSQQIQKINSSRSIYLDNAHNSELKLKKIIIRNNENKA
ncbi:hypothetical protein V6248_05375 [Pseudoalteromonas agarivorans]|uniref:hypothetical protein n=1 Tax=Pseudoalteromonas agarivorans TaxID=176102 RepID=UPI00311F0F02